MSIGDLFGIAGAVVIIVLLIGTLLGIIDWRS
jgi:hypothetical protein